MAVLEKIVIFFSLAVLHCNSPSMFEKNPNIETELPSTIQVENDGYLTSQPPYDYSTHDLRSIHPRLRRENQGLPWWYSG